MKKARRALRWALMLAVVQGCMAPLEAGSSTYFGFTIGVHDAPPPPRVVVVSREEVIVPGTSVYVIDDPRYDVFLYGGSYYCYTGSYWYRARGSRGPFVAVDVRSVPRQVLVVPSGHWKRHPHGGPPGQRGKWGRGGDD